MVYQSENKFTPPTSQEEVTKSGDKKINMATLNREKLISLEIDNKGTVIKKDFEGFYTFFVNDVLNDSKNPPLHKYHPMHNCGVYKFSQCIECGYDVCVQDWRCQLGANISGPAFAVSLMITCALNQIWNFVKRNN